MRVRSERAAGARPAQHVLGRGRHRVEYREGQYRSGDPRKKLAHVGASEGWDPLGNA
jgi:hypothetical protein